MHSLLQLCSANNSGSEDDSKVSSDDRKKGKALQQQRENKDDKKPVKLDSNGILYGNMKEVLAADIKWYAKDLASTTNWKGQHGGECWRFFRRQYSSLLCSACSYFVWQQNYMCIPLIAQVCAL